MGWGRLDDKFPTHSKRRLGSLAADGLLARAIAQTAGQDDDGYGDGFVDEAWIRQQEGWRTALKVAVKARLLEPLPAHATRELTGQARRGLRTKPVTVTVGPFEVDGFLVHDYLDFNPSAAERREKRDADAKRKRRQRGTPKLWHDGPNGASDDDLSRGTGTGDSRAFRRESGMGTSSASSGNDDGDHRELHAVAPIVAVFEELGRPIDEITVANAVSRFPTIDHLAEARGCAEYCRAHPDKPTGHTLHRYFERAKPAAQENPSSARRAAALRAVVEGGGR